MFKKIAVALLIASLFVTISACSVNDKDKDKEAQNRTTTQQITLMRNSFKDVLPSFKFKNEIKEIYVDGLSYKFTVKCSQNDSNDYIKKVKKAGFTVNPAEGTNYYSASTEDYYSVEITYIDGILTVHSKRV